MQKLILADDIIIRMYDLKYSSRFIGNIFHCSHQTIRRVLKENNIKIRNVKEARQVRIDDIEINNRMSKSLKEYYKTHKIVRSEEYKQQIRDRMMGNVISKETRDKISKTLTGRKLTEEHKKNISIASSKRTYVRSEEYIAKQRKRHPSIETLEKMAKAHRGKKFSDETKEKIREARKKQVLPVKDTLPEKYIQNLLKFNNIPFETHKFIPNLLPKEIKNHQFDIVISIKKLLIEIQGCYWHGCKSCFPQSDDLQNKTITRDKIIRDSVKNDNEWKLIEIWEHNINKVKKIEVNKATEIIFGRKI